MKILKEGKIPERKKELIEVIYRIICNNCKCEFECYEDELETSQDTIEEHSMFAFGAGRDVVTREYKKIKCPCCHKTNTIMSKTISNVWKSWDEE